MKTRNPIRQTWRRFVVLWDALAESGPGGLDWDCEVVAEVVTLYARLARAGMRFGEAFIADMARIKLAGRQGDDNESVGDQDGRLGRDQDDEANGDDEPEHFFGHWIVL